MKNKRIVFSTIFFVIFFFCGAHVASSGDKKSLSLSDIEILLKNGVSNQRVIALVDKYGLSFSAKDKDIKKLHSLGADKEVIDVIRRASSKKGITGGKLSVISIPPRAEVFVNTHYKGVAPLTIDVPPVSFELRLGGLEGFEDYVDNVFVANRETKVVEVILEKVSTRTPSINKNIYESNISGDTQNKNTIIDNVLSGDNTDSKIKDINIEGMEKKDGATSTHTQAINGEKKTVGTIYIETIPSGASIYINGQYKAKSPAEISLPGGKFNMVMIKDKYKLENSVLNISKGLNPPIMVRLTPK